MLHKRKLHAGLREAQTVADELVFSECDAPTNSLACHQEGAEYVLHDEPHGSSATH
jgi:hypothetical protein